MGIDLVGGNIISPIADILPTEFIRHSATHFLRFTMDPATVDQIWLHRLLGATLVDSPLDSNGGVRFVVWSPSTENVDLVLLDSGADSNRSVSMRRLDSGYHVAEVDGIGAGQHYQYRFDGGPSRPDPMSRAQFESVHGPSVVVDPVFDWSDADWHPAAVDQWVIYELHIAAFTDDGTFVAAIQRLDELVRLGITAIELMPVADCAGRWNWGYDGVHLFAPNRNYGSPDQLRQLIDAAHAKGLAVILDVVYNHLGPEGNYLGAAGPYMSSKHQTVWGSAPNFDDELFGDECRRFFIANVVYWFDEFHFDALRVDAIHCMRDDRTPHVAAEMADAADQYEKASGRAAIMIAESNVYDPQMLVPTDRGGIGFDAQWSDDFLHATYAAIRPGENLSDRTYHAGSDLKQVLEKGYIYSGTIASFRERQNPETAIDSTRLVRCIQNHDFIGNHPTGKRITAVSDRPTHMALAALMLLSPSIPMLFMGEEFACEHPFSFFVDFGDESLRRGVVEGRRREYPQHDWSAGILPIDEAAFQSSRIGAVDDREMWLWYRDLIRLRKAWIAKGWKRDQTMVEACDPSRNLYKIRHLFKAGETATVSIGLRRFGDQPLAAPMGDVVEPSKWDSRTRGDWKVGDSWAVISDDARG